MEIMRTRLPKQTLYTVDSLVGLSRRCDWFINGTQLINIKNTDTPETIFLTGLKGNSGIKYLVKKLLPEITREFVLIIGSEDYTFPTGIGDCRHNEYKSTQCMIPLLLDSPLLLHIYVENLDTANIKMSPIPLGVIDEMSFPIDLPSDVDLLLRPNLCLSRHRVRNDGSAQWNDRLTVSRLCKTAWQDFVKLIEKEIPKEIFIEEIKQSKFVLCIRGGGYDPCPRFFECILHGAIPIIQHSPLDPLFMRFPVVFIEDLTAESLSEEFLLNRLAELKEFYVGEKRKQVLEMLTLDYWWKIITSNLPMKN